MKGFQQYHGQRPIMEAKGPSATQYESILTVGYNWWNRATPREKKSLTGFVVEKSVDKEAYKIAKDFLAKRSGKQEASNLGQQMAAAKITGEMTQVGGKYKALDTDFINYYKNAGGNKKTDASKSDVMTDSKRISLKKKGGSAIMSAVGSESIATIHCAMKHLNQTTQADGQKIVDIIKNNFHHLFKDNEYYVSGYLSDLMKDPPEKAFAGISKEAINSLRKHAKKMGEKNKEMTVQMNKIINDKKNIGLKNRICWIAVTGNMKFPEDSDAIADTLVEFNPSNTTVSQKIDVDTVQKCAKIAKKTKWRIGYKSSSGTTGPQSSLRVSEKWSHYGESTEMPTYNKVLIETLMDDLELDGEALLNEGLILDEDHNFLTEEALIKGLWDKVVDKFKKIGGSVTEWLAKMTKKVLDKADRIFEWIAKQGGRIWDWLLKFFGLVPDTGEISGIPQWSDTP